MIYKLLLFFCATYSLCFIGLFVQAEPLMLQTYFPNSVNLKSETKYLMDYDLGAKFYSTFIHRVYQTENDGIDIHVYRTEYRDGFNTSQLNFNGIDGPTNLNFDDLNADGKTDVIINGFDSRGLYALENIDGVNFNTRTLIDNFRVREHYAITDIDGDGRQDVVAGTIDEELLWYKQLEDGTFQAESIALLNNLHGNSLDLEDLDGNGVPDLVLPQGATEEVTWFRYSNGAWQAQVVGLTTDGPNSIDIKDLNQDGIKDLVVSDRTSIILARRDNSSSTSISSRIDLEIPLAGANVEATHATDFDLDGDIDLLVLVRNQDMYELGWFQNQATDPNNTFEGPYNYNFLLNSNWNNVFFRPFDVDLDGDLDIYLSQYTGGGVGSETIWIPNMIRQ